MARWIVERRDLTSALVAAGISAFIWTRLPWPAADPVLRLIEFHQRALYDTFEIGYAVLLFTTPSLACSVVLSFAYMLVARHEAATGRSELPAHPDPRMRESLFLKLGERHHPTRPGPSRRPEWLVLGARGLFTGIAIVRAVGTGKTSAHVSVREPAPRVAPHASEPSRRWACGRGHGRLLSPGPADPDGARQEGGLALRSASTARGGTTLTCAHRELRVHALRVRGEDQSKYAMALS